MTNLNKGYALVGVALVVSLLLSATAIVVSFSKKSSDSGFFGSVQRGEQVFEDGAQLGDNVIQTFEAELAEGSDEVVVFNNNERGKTFIATDFFVHSETKKQASSSHNYILTATASTSIPNVQDYTPYIFDATSTFAKYRVATTTNYATTTSKEDLVRYGRFSGLEAFAQNQISVKHLERLIFYRQQGDLLRCATGQEAGKCERATSTNAIIGTLKITVKGFFRN